MNTAESWNWHCPKCGQTLLGHSQLVGSGKCSNEPQGGYIRDLAHAGYEPHIDRAQLGNPDGRHK